MTQAAIESDDDEPAQDGSELASFEDQQAAYRASTPYCTPAEQAFAEHWAYNRNQIKAYQHAFPGTSFFAAKVNASRLFRTPRVQSEIRRIIERWTDHSTIRINQLEHQASRLAYSDLRALYDEHGDIRPPHEWDADAAAAVHTLKTETTYDKKGNATVKRTVRMHDKLPALRTLLEIRGAFDKKKAPPGIQASFTFNMGSGPQAPGMHPQTFTVDMDTSKPARAPKAAARSPKPRPVAEKLALQAPEPATARVVARPKPVKRAPVTVEQPKEADRQPEPVAVGTPTPRKALFSADA